MASAPASAASAIAAATVRRIRVRRDRGPPGLGRRHERVEHRLLAGRGLAQLLDPGDRRIERGHDHVARAGVRRRVAPRRPPARINAVPYSGPAAPPTVLISVRPAVLQPRPGDGPWLVAVGSAGVDAAHGSR